MTDIIALQSKLRSNFSYREFETDFGAKAKPAQPQAGLLLSDLFARLMAPAPVAA